MLGIGLRAALILTGIFLMGSTLLSLAKRKMTDSFVLTWGLVSGIFVVAGILLNPAGLDRYISGTGVLLLGSAGFCLLFGAFIISVRVSELTRKNLELTMQVCLIKRELEEMQSQMALLQGPCGEEERTDEEAACGSQYAGAGRG